MGIYYTAPCCENIYVLNYNSACTIAQSLCIFLIKIKNDQNLYIFIFTRRESFSCEVRIVFFFFLLTRRLRRLLIVRPSNRRFRWFETNCYRDLIHELSPTTAGIVRSWRSYRQIETSFRTAGRGENSMAGVYTMDIIKVRFKREDKKRRTV